VIGAVLAVRYFFDRVDEQIRCHVQARLAQQYPGLSIKIRSAVLIKGEGIQVRGLSIVEPGALGPGAEVLSFDECFFACNTDLQEWLGGEPQVTRVVLRRPTLRMTRRPDGTWSAARLLPIPKLSHRPPEVTVENGTIEIFDPLKTPCGTLTLRDVNLTLTPMPQADGPSGADRRKLQGSLSGDYCRQVVFEGMVDPHRPEFAVNGSLEGLEISPELRDALPGALGGQLVRLGTLRGQGELTFHVSYDEAAPSPWDFDINGRLVHGRLDDPRLPHPLTDIRARVHLHNEGFTVEDLVARSNQAMLRMSCLGAGLGPNAPLHVEAEVRQLELDSQLGDALPGFLQDQWYKYRPEGQIDADVKLSYDGHDWKPEMTLRLLTVSFTHHKFPYRLDHGKGNLCLKDDLLRVNVTAFTGNQPVRIDGEMRHPVTGPIGWIEAKGDDLPLDEKFLTALHERPRAVARALDLRGTASFIYRLWRETPEEPFHQHLVMGAKRCWIKYEHFPYSLQDVRGTLEMTDGVWRINDLEGINGSGRVSCSGGLTPGAAGNRLDLHFRGDAVSLDDELRESLPPAMRQVWHDLKPRGVIDLTADLHYLDQANQLDLSVQAQPRSETASIEPVYFPYRLEKLQGVLAYRNGRLTLERIKAQRGLLKVAMAGFCNFLPDGGWHLHLDGLTVDRLRIDRELVQAVPARLKKALIELNPSGPINLRGTFDMARTGSPGGPLRCQWNLAVGLEQVALDCGVHVENIHGGLTLVGGFDGQNFHSSGELALDSLSYKDFQFTQVLGPLWIDDQQALLGSWAERRQNEVWGGSSAGQRPARRLTAQIFGGTVYGDAAVIFGPQPRYSLAASLVDAKLDRCAQEVVGGRQQMRGAILAGIELRGLGHSTLSGHGSIQLRDANVYELPLMIAMLKILSIRPPDPNAFSKSDIDYRIEGEHIYFDKLDFSGDAISLLGKGEMNFQSEIHLTFAAIVGRGDISLPAVRALFTGASQQFMLIHVVGTLQNPETRKEAFPGINQALQQLQSDLQGK
jgi:hypothetical protein